MEKVYGKCGIKLPAADGTGGPSQERLSTYSAAVKGSCGSASTQEACCKALKGVGASCLQGMMAGMAADPAPASAAKLAQLKSYLDLCTEEPTPDIDAPAGPSPGRSCEPGLIALCAAGNGMVGICLSSEKELKQCCGVLKGQSDACFKQCIAGRQLVPAVPAYATPRLAVAGGHACPSARLRMQRLQFTPLPPAALLLPCSFEVMKTRGIMVPDDPPQDDEPRADELEPRPPLLD